MFNFELLFLDGFSSQHRKILHKAVLTPEEYEDYFFWEKIENKFLKSKLVWKETSHKITFLEKAIFEKTPPLHNALSNEN